MKIAVTLLLFASAIVAKDLNNDNDISSSSTPSNLDQNLRKALLQALTELENETPDKNVVYTTTGRPFSTDFENGSVVTKASASSFSFLAKDEDQENANEESNDERQSTEKPIVIIQKSSGVQHRPIISVLSNQNDDELIKTSASSNFGNSNFQQKNELKNLGPNSVTINDKSITPGDKSVSITPKYETTTNAITTIPTTTTEENQAKVEDVQFFSAPLVAAFTVHQDERGVPNKVEPIFKIDNGININTRLNAQETKGEDLRVKQKLLEQQVFTLQEQRRKQEEFILRQQQLLREQQLQQQQQRPFNSVHLRDVSSTPKNTFTNFVEINTPNPLSSTRNVPLALSTSVSSGNFETFTKSPLGTLGTTRNAFNFEVNKQQLPSTTPAPIFNNFALQSNNANGFQKQFSNGFTPIKQFSANQFSNNNQFSQSQFNANQFNKFSNNFQKPKFGNTFVSFQPSVSLSPSDLEAGKLPLNAQIPPVRNAIDFLQSPNPNPAFSGLQPLNSFQNNNFLPAQNLPLRQSNRVFRNEQQVGNLGLNFAPSFSNNFDANRFHRSNFYQPQQQIINNQQQLQNLLYHSGITRNVRQNEDLSLVSKVLSYNFGSGGHNFFGPSRLSDQRQ